MMAPVLELDAEMVEIIMTLWRIQCSTVQIFVETTTRSSKIWRVPGRSSFALKVNITTVVKQ